MYVTLNTSKDGQALFAKPLCPKLLCLDTSRVTPDELNQCSTFAQVRVSFGFWFVHSPNVAHTRYCLRFDLVSARQLNLHCALYELSHHGKLRNDTHPGIQLLSQRSIPVTVTSRPFRVFGVQ